jgi:hypothetical protein
MYSFKIKADASDIDIPAVRSLLVFAAFIIAISRNNHTYAVNIVACIILIMAAFVAELILVKYRIHTLVVVGMASLLLALCTFNIIFPVIMMAIAFILRYLYVPPIIQAEEKGIRIKKTFSNKAYDWALFNQVIVKDGLLTLDFKNNNLLQVELNETTNEESFNAFCAQKIARANRHPGEADI